VTVGELIAALQKLPADLPVYLADWSEGYALDHPMDVSDVPMIVPPWTSRRGHPMTLPERVLIGGSSGPTLELQ
jgi:hypothetical protein